MGTSENLQAALAGESQANRKTLSRRGRGRNQGESASGVEP